MVEILGDVILRTKKYLIDKFGEDDFNTLISDLDEDVKDALSGIIITQKKYDVKVIQEFLRIIDYKYGRKFLIELTCAVADQELTGLWGLIVKFVSIERLNKQANSMFQKFYSEGEVVPISVDESEIVFEVRDFVFTESHRNVFMYYMGHIFERVKKKKIMCSSKKIDERTTEFRYFITSTAVE